VRPLFSAHINRASLITDMVELSFPSFIRSILFSSKYRLMNDAIGLSRVKDPNLLFLPYRLKT